MCCLFNNIKEKEEIAQEFTFKVLVAGDELKWTNVRCVCIYVCTRQEAIQLDIKADPDFFLNRKFNQAMKELSGQGKRANDGQYGSLACSMCNIKSEL